MTDTDKLLKLLLKTTTTAGIAKILADLGDTPGMQIEQPFCGDRLVWKAVGDNAQNFASAGVSTDPARALTERVTNAIDAITEFEIRKQIVSNPSFQTPMEAARFLFSRPEGAMAVDKWMEEDVRNQKVAMLIHDDELPDSPTIDVLDEGIGVRPEQFHLTLVSLQRGNKRMKFYLCGAYGQGGLATTSFSKYTLIVSRSEGDPTIAGFTVVRHVYTASKFPCVAYLAMVAPDGTESVMSASAPRGMDLYGLQCSQTHVAKKWGHGTLVRHFGYSLTAKYSKSQAGGQAEGRTGNLYGALQGLMPEPILAFRLFDLRSKYSKGPRSGNRVGGIASRIDKLRERMEMEEKGVSRTECLHYERFSVPDGSGGMVPVTAVALKGMKKHKNTLVLRNSTQALFGEEGKPVIFQCNGQNQGTCDAATLRRETGLRMLADHMVVIADLTGIDAQKVHEIITTSRESLKRTPTTETILRNIFSTIKSSEEFRECDQQLERLVYSAKREGFSADDKASLFRKLKALGLQMGGNKLKVKASEDPKTRTVQKVPVSKYPAVNVFAITTKDGFEIPIGSARRVSVTTDAADRFGKEGLVSFSLSGPAGFGSVGTLCDGKMSWTLVPSADAREGDKVTFRALIKDPLTNSVVISAEVSGVISPPEEVKNPKDATGPGSGMVNLDVSEVDPDKDVPLFHRLWLRHGIQAADASFHVESANSSLRLFWCSKFSPLVNVLQAARTPRQKHQILAAYREMLSIVAYTEHVNNGGKSDLLDNPELMKHLLACRSNDAAALVAAASEATA